VLACILASGCGPIEYITTVTFQASKAVANARRAGAERLAPYEFTLSTEYLHEARELAGFARYQEAVDFGRDALKWGTKAQALALEKAARPNEKNE